MSIIKNKDVLLFYRRQAEMYLNRMREGTFSDGAQLHEQLYPYILCKYSLLGDCEDIYDLDELAKRSVAKTIRLTERDAFRADSSASCEGTTSAMNKKVLLLMAIQRDLQVKFPVGETADLTDTRLIADAVYRLMKEKTDAEGPGKVPEPRGSVREEQDAFIRDFNDLDDWMLQYNCLLELTADMAPLRPEEKTDRTLVRGCQAKLWLVLSCEDGLVSVRADSEALIVKGIVAVIAALLDMRSPQEICEAEIDFIEKTPLGKQISTDRFKGMQTVIRMIKEYAQGLLPENFAPSPPTSKN